MALTRCFFIACQIIQLESVGFYERRMLRKKIIKNRFHVIIAVLGFTINALRFRNKIAISSTKRWQIVVTLVLIKELRFLTLMNLQ